MIKAVLLDMDGVLAEVKASYRACILETAKSYGVHITSEEVTAEKVKGNANNDWILTRKMMHDRGVDVSLEEVTAAFDKLYQELCMLETLIPARGVLEALYNKVGGKMAIVTGRPAKDCQFFLKRFNLEHLVVMSVCMEDGPAKPHPNSVQMACKALNVRPEDAIMIGDTPDDIKAAVAAGAKGIGVLLQDDHAKTILSGSSPNTIPVVQSMLQSGAISIIRPGLADLLDLDYASPKL